MACSKFNCSCRVVVKKSLKQDEFYKSLKNPDVTKPKRIVVNVPKMENSSTESRQAANNIADDETSSSSIDESDAIIMNSLYDITNSLVELSLFKISKQIPRVMMQVLGLIVPHYKSLTKISIRKCSIDFYSIHELSKMLPLSSVTEICLDDSSIPEANYAHLLKSPSHLKNLSLCRCDINDDVCEQIAYLLHYTPSNERKLQNLNLSSNRITDLGAQFFGEALRSNRTLRYLNLAGNCIGDYGADYIFRALMKFPLTCEEVIATRGRYIEYLKKKRLMNLKYMDEFDTMSIDERSRKSSTRRRKSSTTTIKSLSKSSTKRDKDRSSNSSTVDDCILSAHLYANDLLGPYNDPHGSEFVKIERDCTYCVGNMTLSYLNLSYNDLTYMSIKKILELLVYQNRIHNQTQKGLLKIVIDGNYMPEKCCELNSIEDIMKKNIIVYSSKISPEQLLRRRSLATPK